MYKLNLIVFGEMCNSVIKDDIEKAFYKENSQVWIFNDFENYGLGCTGLCTNCDEGFIAIDDVEF